MKPNFAVIMILLLIVIIPNTASIGIRPHETKIEFRPNLQYNGSFLIVNEENSTGQVKLSVDKELAGMVGLKEQNITQSADTKSNLVFFSIRLPSTMDEGMHEAKIKVSPKWGLSQGIGVSIIMSHTIKVNVLPEYSRLLLDISYESPALALTLKNPRDQEINNLRIALEISDGIKTLESINFAPIKIDAQGTKEIIQKNIRLKPGIYQIKYDVKSNTFNFSNQKELIAGKHNIVFTPQTSILKANQINRIPSEIENIWNKKTEAIILLQLFNRTQKLAQFSSGNIELAPYEKRNIDLYLESQKIPKGNYTLKFSLTYGKEKAIIEKDIELISGIEIQKIEIWPMILGSIIVIMLVALLLFMKRRKNESRKR